MDVATPELTVLDLFSGFGGFQLAFQQLGLRPRVLSYVEWDPFAAATLLARMEDQAIPSAPVWCGDVADLDTRPFVGVDLVCGGWPCQPFSAAGLKRGVVDDRWLWPGIARIIGDVGPRLVFLENVPQLVKHGLPYVLADLASMGFDAEWGLLSAAAVGAPHKRERFWLLAHAERQGLETSGRTAGSQHAGPGGPGDEMADDDGFGGQRGSGLFDRVGTPLRHDTHRSSGADVGNTGGARRPEVAGGPHGDEATDAGRAAFGGDEPHRPGEDVAGAAGLGGDEGIGRPARRRGSVVEGDRFPPGPDDAVGWERWTAQGGPQPSVRRSVDGATGRMERPIGLADRLHLLGNGLVPIVAAHAFAILADRLGIGRIEER